MRQVGVVSSQHVHSCRQKFHAYSGLDTPLCMVHGGWVAQYSIVHVHHLRVVHGCRQLRNSIITGTIFQSRPIYNLIPRESGMCVWLDSPSLLPLCTVEKFCHFNKILAQKACMHGFPGLQLHSFGYMCVQANLQSL